MRQSAVDVQDRGMRISSSIRSRRSSNAMRIIKIVVNKNLLKSFLRWKLNNIQLYTFSTVIKSNLC